MSLIFSNSTVFLWPGIMASHTNSHIQSYDENWDQTTFNSHCKTMCLYVKPYDYKPQKAVNYVHGTVIFYS
jgi:hypothetical protein